MLGDVCIFWRRIFLKDHFAEVEEKDKLTFQRPTASFEFEYLYLYTCTYEIYIVTYIYTYMFYYSQKYDVGF